MTGAPALAAIDAALRAAGLCVRGAFHPAPDDAVPALPDGRGARTVVLAGLDGAAGWAAFERGRRDEPDPLDRWSARALAALAARFGGAVVMPNDGPPWPPFQRWAQRGAPLHRSPLGLSIHPVLGLWQAWRGALLLAEPLALPDVPAAPSPCDACAERPCLSSCPVGAFTAQGFDAAACAAHLRAPAGRACRDGGCLARRACPVGREYAYGAAQQRFHLDAFLRAHEPP